MALSAWALLDEIVSDTIVSPFTVGCLLPLSGRYKAYGQKALRGIELAYHQHVAAGGQPGIRLVVKDTQADPFRTVAMCLFHDMQETRVGDLHRINQRYLEHEAAEEKAIKDQLSRVPQNVGTQIRALYKDLIEEMVFYDQRDLFSELELVFFDTTSIYFEGRGGETIGQKGFSKDHRPDLNQMVVGAIIDDKGRPICCEMWPGNTTDVKTLIPVIDRVRKRFGIHRFCIVADRGMISAETIKELEERNIAYILGTRMRLVKEIKLDVLSRGGRYKKVYPEGVTSKDPAPLKVKQVLHNKKRYIVCLNQRQARKDARDREAIIASLKEQLKKGPKSLVGNKGYRKYLKLDKDSARIDMHKVEYESRFDGKWILTTNMNLAADKVALKYKELWQVERVFRDVKSILETRPVYHQRNENIRGHVFCSFLALVLRKELEQRLNQAGHVFEWSDIKQDLKALQQVTIEEDGKCFAIRSECKGHCGKIFQAVKVALPPTIREVT